MQSLIGPLDRIRGALLREVAPLPIIGDWVRRRESRIALRAAVAIVSGMLLALIAPAFALAIGPVLFGVPHAASSLRYLVLRQGFSRLRIGFVALYAVADASLRISEQVRGTPHVFAALECALGVLLGVVTIGAAVRDGARFRRAVGVLAIVVVLGVIGIAHPLGTRLAFIHVHNLAVVVLWLVHFRRRARDRATLPSALLLIALVAVLVFGLVGVPPFTNAAGVDLAEVSVWLAPGMSAGIALALVLAHAFTDSVHYAFWLGVVPEETLSGEGTPTFRMTLASLKRDFGGGFVVLAVATLLVPALALYDFRIARRAYFALAGFHGHIEAAAIVYLATRPRALNDRARHDLDRRASCVQKVEDRSKTQNPLHLKRISSCVNPSTSITPSGRD